LAGHRTTPSPRYETRAFIEAIAQFVRDESIDLVLPAFEEVFYLAAFRHQLGAPLFAPALETLQELHNKASLLTLARSLGLAVPPTEIAHDPAELGEAIARFEHFFARPAYSRGGVDLFTNTGPLAGAVDQQDCLPTPHNPWLVQSFVDGTDICCFAVAHHGHVAAFSSYVHPREIEHAGGIVFHSIVDDQALRITRQLVQHTRYHGQVSFDFKRTDAGLVLIECNPRPTAGVIVMDQKMFVDALFDPDLVETRVAEAGVQSMFSVALVRDMLLHWSEIPEDLHHLMSAAREVYAEPGDLLPGLYQLLSYSHVLGYRLRVGAHRTNKLMAAYFHDIQYDGQPIDSAVPALNPPAGSDLSTAT
jgi:glutathione synthase/RimK-type ligase-like ATP-grasp enzyme